MRQVCAALFAVLLVSPALKADTLTIDGAVFDVAVTHLSWNTYEFQYTIDTTGYTGPGHYLDSVALSPSGANILSGSFSSAYDWTGEPGTQQGGGGCGGGDGNSWCAQAAGSTGLLAVPGGIYEFDFMLTLTAPLIDLSNAHIQASFGNVVNCQTPACVHYQNQLGISTAITMDDPPSFAPTAATVPESSGMALLGSGLIGLVGLVRRKLRT